MIYSVIRGLFLIVQAMVIYSLVPHYFFRRSSRLSPDRTTTKPVASAFRPFTRQTICIFVLVNIVNAVVAAKIDDRSDDFRHAFSLPASSIDALLLVSFATASIAATILVTLIGLVELYDRLHAKYRL